MHSFGRCGFRSEEVDVLNSLGCHRFDSNWFPDGEVVQPRERRIAEVNETYAIAAYFRDYRNQAGRE